MKKHISVVLFFAFLLPIPEVCSWSNGWESYPYANNIADFGYRNNYGTADWIADGVIWRLQQADSFRYRWLSNFMYHIFIGTESPFNTGIDCFLNKTRAYGRGDFNSMNISFSNNVLTSNVMDRVNSTYTEILNQLRLYNFDMAAFYLGEMIGYIQYASFFPIYSINGKKYDTYAIEIERSVYKYTSGENSSRYFIWTASTLSTQSPHDLVRWMITNIYNGSSMNCSWFNATFPYIDPITQRRDWIENSNITQRNYYYRIEQILNMAVHVSASLFHSCMIATNTVGGNFMPYSGKFAHASMEAWIVIGCSIAGSFVFLLIVQWRKNR